MLDAPLRRIIDPPLNMMGRALAKTGISADTVTVLSLITGLLAALAVALGAAHLALWLVLLSRLADGLDGAVARATTRTDFGGYLDITADFLFYGAIPLAFVIANPATNGLAGALLLTSFYFNGASFLGYAILAERHGLETSERGSKSLYFTGGLLEGTETILVLRADLPAAGLVRAARLDLRNPVLRPRRRAHRPGPPGLRAAP